MFVICNDGIAKNEPFTQAARELIGAFREITSKITLLEYDLTHEVAGKWNYDMHNPDIERRQRHPGGRIVSTVMDTFLGWKFSRIGKIYMSLE